MPADTQGETLTEVSADETPAATASGEPTLETLQTRLTETQAALKRANSESAGRRKRLEAFEKAQTDRETAKLSEIEQAQTLAEEWEGKYNSLSSELAAARLRRAFYEEADVQKMVFVNAQAKRDALSLASLTDVTVKEGQPVGITAAVKALGKSHPHLFGAPIAAKNINSGAAGQGHSKAAGDQLIEFAASLGLETKYLDPSLVARAIQ